MNGEPIICLVTLVVYIGGLGYGSIVILGPVVVLDQFNIQPVLKNSELSLSVALEFKTVLMLCIVVISAMMCSFLYQFKSGKKAVLILSCLGVETYSGDQKKKSGRNGVVLGNLENHKKVRYLGNRF